MKGYSSLYSYGQNSPYLYSDFSSSLHGKPQKYHNEYSVYSKMRKKDIKHGIYSTESGYAKNPTQQNLKVMVKGNYIVGKQYNKRVPYVITANNEVIIGDRNGNGRYGKPTPHPTLVGGKDPKVRMAGMLDIRGGKIYSYDDRSGHYRPNEKSIKWADEAFKNYPKAKGFKGGKTNE